LPDLARNGIRIVTWDSLDDREREAVKAYYNETVFPVLTPLAVDPGGLSRTFRTSA
jgi:polyphosphate kinase